MSILRVCLFGRFAIKVEDCSLPLDVAKAQELLAYLLLHRHQAHYREKLATLLWPESSASQSKGYLRQTLWQLQSALGEHSHLLSVEADWIRIAETASLWLDVASFEQAAAAAQGIPGNRLGEAHVAALQEATTLYRADLLEHWFQDWCLFERERLHNAHLVMLEKLIAYYEAHGRYEEGISCATRLLRCEPAHERTYYCLMRLHALGGDRTAALRSYERCTSALQEGLGVAPGRRTTALYQQLLGDNFPPDNFPPDNFPADNAPAGSSPAGARSDMAIGNMLTRLELLEQALVEAQHQVTREVEALRQILFER